MKYLKVLLAIAIGILVSLFLGALGMNWAYQIRTEGVIKLKNARGVITITRETDNMIPHIRGGDHSAVSYGQGFVDAQTNLWSIELKRRYISGRLSELFGESTLAQDKLMRAYELTKLA